MTRNEVVRLMKTSKSEKEWNENCQKVKKAHNGSYPNYWFATFISNGLINDILYKKSPSFTLSGEELSETTLKNNIKCIFCKKEIKSKNDFKDNKSWIEYGISFLCQECQDKVFT